MAAEFAYPPAGISLHGSGMLFPRFGFNQLDRLALPYEVHGRPRESESRFKFRTDRDPFDKWAELFGQEPVSFVTPVVADFVAKKAR